MTDYAPLKASLEKEEGRKAGAYRDSRGILTIGVGFNIDADHGGGLDDTEIDFILENRVAKAEAACKAYPWFDALSDPRKCVIVDMVYNMGAQTFAQFHGTIHCIAVGAFGGAAGGMRRSLWATQVGYQRSERLAQIMETDVWKA